MSSTRVVQSTSAGFAIRCRPLRRAAAARPAAWSCAGRRQLRVPTRCRGMGVPKTEEREVGTDAVGGNGSGNDDFQGNGRGDDDDAEDGDSSIDEDELLNLAEAESLAAEKGFELPQDYAAAARSGGLRASTLRGFANVQALPFAGALVWMLPWVRDRMVADPRFLYKVFVEVAIDSGCATVAEVRKRGQNFWGEFEFYLSDMAVGFVLDVALVTMLAPVAVVGAKPPSSSMSGLMRWWARLPSAVFEKSIPNVRKYTLADRVACFLVKGIEYSIVGLCCGFVGQGVANSLMLLRRRLRGGATEEDVIVPPLVRTALVWALFMGASSNVRYQTVVGLERTVDMTIAKTVPQVAYGTTVIIRFINNVIGGENFIDLARWAGVQ
ncbi:unnamed protein product [Ostreobium quekettii]|uniref:Uncharacterized protein n=1 Tax=Ostreobium quekettii TaxID=121088 RepID=A0A8S1JC51_9CHLO|nr:unnamed protein product [Ostreobium quekettii]|eukprot:evm.model.scf_839.4 EVM.evm.TU.scf_839.4   scf_839:33175-39615(+)